MFARPRHIGYIAIDEIAVAKGRRYLTLVKHLQSGAVVHVGDGKGVDALEPFWELLQSSRAKLETVAKDMSAAYRKEVASHLLAEVIVFN